MIYTLLIKLVEYLRLWLCPFWNFHIYVMVLGRVVESAIVYVGEVYPCQNKM